MPRREDPGFDDDIVCFVVSDLRTVWPRGLLLLMRGAIDRVWTESISARATGCFCGAR